MCSGYSNIPYLHSFNSHNAPTSQETEAQRGATMYAQSQLEGGGGRSLPKVSLSPEPVLDTEMLRVTWLGGTSQPRLQCLSRGLSLSSSELPTVLIQEIFLSACPPFLLRGLPGLLVLGHVDSACEANGQSWLQFPLELLSEPEVRRSHP